jgi:hypothetical protein
MVVRDMADADCGLARAVAEGTLPGPRLFAGGKAVSQAGGHGDLRLAGQNVHDTHYWTPGLADPALGDHRRRPCGPVESVAVTATFEVLAVLGMLEVHPIEELIDRPVGSPVAR